jgi:pyruvate dehydrogenase E2 component (dihydrolipoamide acetyltransferase)
MAVAIEMPKPGVTVEECLLVKWIKQEGEIVQTGDVVAEIETDKATFEINSPSDGTLLATFFPEGELVPVYSNLCVIGEPGESVESFRPQQIASGTPAPRVTPVDTPAAPEEKPAIVVQAATSAFASPRARRFAEERRISLSGIAGSGPGGRILESDVKDAWYSWYSRTGGVAAAAAPTPMPAAPVRVPEKRPTGIRDRIARRMRESLGTTAQYTLTASADASALLEVRRRFKSSNAAVDINLNELVMLCAVKALMRSPELNAEYVNGELRKHSAVHVGFACDTPRGLLVPVVKNAHELEPEPFASAVKVLTAQAVEGKISPDDLTGATFTISNLGALGIESFTPILNPPQVAILGVNAIDLRPVRRDGAVEFVDRIGFSLTLDHQAIDGAPGARFLQTLRNCVENVGSLFRWTV